MVIVRIIQPAQGGKRKLVQSYWGVAESGRKRKYDRIRGSGVGELADLRMQQILLRALRHDPPGGAE